MKGLTHGRIVHFVVPTGVHRGAMVVNVKDKEKGICDLFVFSMPQDATGGFFMYTDAVYDEKETVNTWHWMEKE